MPTEKKFQENDDPDNDFLIWLDEKLFNPLEEKVLEPLDNIGV